MCGLHGLYIRLWACFAGRTKPYKKFSGGGFTQAEVSGVFVFFRWDVGDGSPSAQVKRFG